MYSSLLTFFYLIASVTFIVGLKMLSHPASARKGNMVAAIGMAIAVLGTIFLYEKEGEPLGNYGWIFSGILLGTILGTLSAKRVKMTAMPEMVSLFNGMGGACAALISLVEFDHLLHADPINILAMAMNGGVAALQGFLLIVLLGLIIGSISFAGSVIAWGK
jgi:NAD(P) transhydrogenase subunit beta